VLLAARADLSLDAVKAEGSVSIDTAAARPAVEGKLDADKLDLNPDLLPDKASTARLAPVSGPAPASSSQAGRSDTSVSASQFELADVGLDLKVGGIIYRNFQVGPSALVLRVKDGRLTADLSRMALYRGSGGGTVTVDGSGAMPSVGLNFALAQVQIAPLAEAATNTNRLAGTGKLDIAVTGRGTSQREFITTLSGRGALSLANGQINGVDLPALAESAVKIERDFIRTLNVTDTLNLLAHGQINRIAPLARTPQRALSAGATSPISQR
jgi:AsmA protein